MTQKMDPKEADRFVKTLSKYVMTGNYKSGLLIAKRTLKQYPNELICQYQYAKLLGDWADELPLARRKKLKLQAARILKPLTKRLAGENVERRFGICLNYYYQSAAFKDMYAFGKRFVSQNKRKGLYAQALGAVLQAELLNSRGRAHASWAKKSARAWEKYDLSQEPYYFAHYSYAKALALLGDSRRALKSLKVAARKSQRTVDDWEFKDVMELISKNHVTSRLA